MSELPGQSSSALPVTLVLLLDEQNSDNGMALKLIKDLYGSSLERGFVQLGRQVAGIVFLNAALRD